ncbi:MAG: hypothetical protein NTW14_09735, partial [bacterium]|nr:hypothetical protein [bacterium]
AFYGQTNRTIDDGDTISIVVSSYDFGAHGDILIEAQSESTNWWYNLTKYQRRDTTWVSYSTIPIDEDNPPYTKCGMADYWKTSMLADTLCPDTITIISQIEPTQDLDDYIHGVLACDLGDWLNTFEEYRGFYCQGVHTRTSPWKKDFFVYSNLGSLALNTGIGYAEQIGRGLGHWIAKKEMQSYIQPNTHIKADSFLYEKSVNWLNDRIITIDTCACSIFLNNYALIPVDDSTGFPLGLTSFDTIQGAKYIIPRTVRVGFVFSKRIRYITPPDYNYDSINALDTNWQDFVAGHEIGHMVDFRHNANNDSSIMTDTARSIIPTDQYFPVDLDSFLVKPRLP